MMTTCILLLSLSVHPSLVRLSTSVLNVRQVICFVWTMLSYHLSRPYLLIGQRYDVFDGKNDLPPVSRLNTVHHSGVPCHLCHEHFVFVSESTELVMTYDGDYVISARGYWSDSWHARWYEVYRSAFVREILPIWYESVSYACMCQCMRHGFDDINV